MSTQVASISVGKKETVAPASGVQRLALFVVFLICSLAIFVFGCNYFDIFPTNRNLNYQVILSAVFLIAAVWFKRDEQLSKYWQIAFAFFVAVFAVIATSLIGNWNLTILGWFNMRTDGTSQFQAINKVYEMLMVVVPILVLTKLSGANLGSLYLKRGNLKWGLSIGALVFFNFAASAFLFFATRYTSIDTLLMPIAIPFYVANTLTLGLACGYLIMKTDSVWGAVLIHAAADLFLFIATLASA
jgi:membrane protease YdiL (CAAX protease family)